MFSKIIYKIKKNWSRLDNDWWENRRWIVFKRKIENENFCWKIGVKLGNYFFQEILWKDYDNYVI